MKLSEDERLSLIERLKKHKIKWCELMHPKNWQPFTDVNLIPDVPVYPKEEYISEVIPHIVRCGGIPKDQLKDGVAYIGSCRNSSEGVWDAANNEFKIRRYKWGMWQDDTVQHFEDGADNSYDVFIPIKEKDKSYNDDMEG